MRATTALPPALTADGAKAGMSAEGAQAAARSGSKQLTVQEARQILGLDSGASWEEIVRKYDHLFEVNDKHGSFYLQSKVYRAKERLEQEFLEQGKPMPGFSEQGQDAGQQQRRQEQ